ncbi:MAG: hypothetical protein U0354_01035 [Candidatus Sericytochromatia bacterium]
MDPFKIFSQNEDYYTRNFVGSNRELVCFKTFEKNKDKYKYNSFILGSSRSLAFKVTNWAQYLPKSASGFHFDASGEGIYGINNKLIYFEKNNIKINNVLIILDEKCITVTKIRKGFIHVSIPELSNESKWSFYKNFLLANLSLRFSISYLDYKFFGEFRRYMKGFINPLKKYDSLYNAVTGDFYYSYDKEIKENKELFYNKLIKDGIFYNRKEHFKKDRRKVITLEEINILKSINDILKRNNTNYKIVISPLYDQIVFDKERLKFLNNLFGKENVYDFSGENKYTRSIYNYYETSHYRTHVADDIMKRIYRK